MAFKDESAKPEPQPVRVVGNVESRRASKDEKSAVRKRAVRAACDALHALRPQPRAVEIEAILDQIRAMEDPPADDKAAAAKAEELYKASQPPAEKTKAA